MVLCPSQDIAHRRPYEPILLCRPAESLLSPAAGAAQPIDGEGGAVGGSSSQGEAPCTQQQAHGGGKSPGHGPPEVPDGVVLLSVPAQHSRKPHLGPLLCPYLPPRPRCLEVSMGRDVSVCTWWLQQAARRLAAQRWAGTQQACRFWAWSACCLRFQSHRLSCPAGCCRCLRGSCSLAGPAGATSA